MTAEVTALQAVLAAENAAIYGYGVVGAYLGGGQQDEAKSDWHEHLIARDELSGMIARLGAAPAAAQAAYELPFRVTGPDSAKRLAAYLEDGVTRAYLAAVALTELRSWGAAAMRPPALRAARWRGGTLPFPGLAGSPD
jgi:hypothetical protein